MNEENKNQDDGYQEIDVSKPQQEEPERKLTSMVINGTGKTILDLNENAKLRTMKHS